MNDRLSERAAVDNAINNKKQQRILHVEDSPRDAEIIRERLIDAGFSMQLDWAAGEQEFSAFLHGSQYDIILADYQLPGFDALEALKIAQTLAPDVPFICVSGAIGEDKAVEILRQGATDYVTKAQLDKLPLAVERALGEVRARTARRLAEEALRESEKKYRLLFDNVNDVIIIHDEQRRILEVNTLACARLGYTYGELTSMMVDQVDTPDEAAHLPDRGARLLEFGRMVFETVHKRKDGLSVPTEVSSCRITWDGQPAVISICRDITERKQTEEDLRESIARLKVLFGATSDSMILIDSHGKILDLNEHTARRRNVDIGTMLGKNLFDFLPPEAAARREKAVSQVIDLGKPVQYQETRDGKHYFIRLFPVLDNFGKVFRVASFSNDITEVRQEEEFREMAGTILQILNNSGDMQDCMQRVLAILKSEIGLDAVGIRLQEGEDYPYQAHEGFSRDFLLLENSLLERSADGGACRDKNGKVKLECTCGLVISGKTDPQNPLFTAGGSCWMNDSFPLLDIPACDDPRLHPRNTCIHQGYASVALVPIRNKEQIIGLIHLNDRRKGCFSLKSIEHLEGIASHIGAALVRRQIENDLWQSEARYAATMSAVDDGLWDWYVQSGRAVFSPIYYRMLGYQEGEFPATYDSWQKLVHPDDLARVEKDLQQSLESGEGFIIDLRMKKKSGKWLWVCTRGKAIEKDAVGHALRLVGMLSDITERKKAEEEKETLERQLHHAQKMEAIGTLAGGIAHDFNNILGAILGYAELVQEDSPDGSILRKDIDQVVKASHRAKELVKQILAFSRQAETERILMQPAIIVMEAVKMLRSSLPATIDIQQNIDMNTGPILADPTQIHQIVMNLGTNAFHAMEGSNGTLSVSLQRKALADGDIVSDLHIKPGDFVQLSIGDTGAGIAPEIWGKIFDPYFTTKEIGKGTGMGLSIIHGIVRSYGGSVSFHSRPGEGTVFQVLLPIMAEEVVVEGKPSPFGKPAYHEGTIAGKVRWGSWCWISLNKRER